jgi:hypothetical protein
VEALVLLLVLACPIVMGSLMIWMTISMRRMKSDHKNKSGND